MRNFEFSYTTIATGQRTSFLVRDVGDDDAFADQAITSKIARAIDAALKRVNEITDVTTMRVTDVRTINREDVATVP